MNSPTSTALIALSLIAGAAGAQSTQPVEWKVSEGGNGHWYACVSNGTRWTWTECSLQALAQGGHLACVNSSAELSFLGGLLNGAPNSFVPACSGCRSFGPFIGGFQDATSQQYSEPFGGWRWISGEEFAFAPWGQGEPNDVQCLPAGGVTNSNYLQLIKEVWGTILFNDIDNDADTCYGWLAPSFLIEWSADCNGDGIVDYGQIKNGQLADENANGVPDICETSITGVIPPSVPAQGGSSITINGRNFPAQPVVLVGGVAAPSVVRYSDSRLTAVTPALLPGMASVSVNGFTLADGIYIRPECGSDLDQDGEVTASDIAIVLLDFGPCYSNAANTQPEDPTPFLLKEEPAAVVPQAR